MACTGGNCGQGGGTAGNPAAASGPGAGPPPAQGGGPADGQKRGCKCVCECKPKDRAVAADSAEPGLGASAQQGPVTRGASRADGPGDGTSSLWSAGPPGGGFAVGESAPGGSVIVVGSGAPGPGQWSWFQGGAIQSPTPGVGTVQIGGGGDLGEGRGASREQPQPRLRRDFVVAEPLPPLHSPIPDGVQAEAALSPLPESSLDASGPVQAAALPAPLVAPDYALRHHLAVGFPRPLPVAPPATGCFDLVGERGAPNSGIGASSEPETHDGCSRAGVWREWTGPILSPPIGDSGDALDLTEVRSTLGVQAPAGVFLAESSVGVLEAEDTFEDFQVSPPGMPLPIADSESLPGKAAGNSGTGTFAAGRLGPLPRLVHPPALSGLGRAGLVPPLFTPQREAFDGDRAPEVPEQSAQVSSVEGDRDGDGMESPLGLESGSAGSAGELRRGPDEVLTGAFAPGAGAPSTSEAVQRAMRRGSAGLSVLPSARPSVRPPVFQKPGSGKSGGVSGAMDLADRAEELSNFVHTEVLSGDLPYDETLGDAVEQGDSEAMKLFKDAEMAKEAARKNFSDPKQFDERWKEALDRRSSAAAREKAREARDPRRADVKAANSSAAAARDARDRANQVKAAATRAKGDPKKIQKAKETAKAAKQAAKEAKKAARRAKNAAKYGTKAQRDAANKEAKDKAKEARALALAAQKQLDDAVKPPAPPGSGQPQPKPSMVHLDCGPAKGCGTCAPPCKPDEECVCDWKPGDPVPEDDGGAGGGGTKGKGAKGGAPALPVSPEGSREGKGGGGDAKADHPKPQSEVEALIADIEASGLTEGTSSRARFVRRIVRAFKAFARKEAEIDMRMKVLRGQIDRLVGKGPASGALSEGDKYRLKESLASLLANQTAQQALGGLASGVASLLQQGVSASDRDRAVLAKRIDRLQSKRDDIQEMGRRAVRSLMGDLRQGGVRTTDEVLRFFGVDKRLIGARHIEGPSDTFVREMQKRQEEEYALTHPVPELERHPDDGAGDEWVREEERALDSHRGTLELAQADARAREELAAISMQPLDEMREAADRFLDETPVPAVEKSSDQAPEGESDAIGPQAARLAPHEISPKESARVLREFHKNRKAVVQLEAEKEFRVSIDPRNIFFLRTQVGDVPFVRLGGWKLMQVPLDRLQPTERPDRALLTMSPEEVERAIQSDPTRADEVSRLLAFPMGDWRSLQSAGASIGEVDPQLVSDLLKEQRRRDAALKYLRFLDRPETAYQTWKTSFMIRTIMQDPKVSWAQAEAMAEQQGHDPVLELSLTLGPAGVSRTAGFGGRVSGRLVTTEAVGGAEGAAAGAGGASPSLWVYTRDPVGAVLRGGAGGRAWASGHAPGAWATEEGLKNALVRMWRTGKVKPFQHWKEIPQSAVGEFERVTGIGPFGGWKYGGRQFFTTRPGDINLLTGRIADPTRIQQVRYVGELGVRYGSDTAFWTSVGLGGSLVLTPDDSQEGTGK